MRKLIPLKIYDKGIVQNLLNHMSVTKKLFFRLVRRSEVRRFSLTFRFKSDEFHQKGFKNPNLEKNLRLKKSYCHFLFVQENDVTYVTLKKTDTTTLSFTV